HMINQIENDLTELRIKEQLQIEQQRQQQHQNQQATVGAPQPNSLYTESVHLEQDQFEPLHAPSAFKPGTAPVPPPHQPAMATYQQRPYQQQQTPPKPQRQEYNAAQQSVILQNLFNDMQGKRNNPLPIAFF